jgi:hypothetical protein
LFEMGRMGSAIYAPLSVREWLVNSAVPHHLGPPLSEREDVSLISKDGTKGSHWPVARLKRREPKA